MSARWLVVCAGVTVAASQAAAAWAPHLSPVERAPWAISV